MTETTLAGGAAAGARAVGRPAAGGGCGRAVSGAATARLRRRAHSQARLTLWRRDPEHGTPRSRRAVSCASHRHEACPRTGSTPGNPTTCRRCGRRICSAVGGRRDYGQGPQLSAGGDPGSAASSGCSSATGSVAPTPWPTCCSGSASTRARRGSGGFAGPSWLPAGPLDHDLRIAVAARASGTRRGLGRDVAGDRAGRVPRRA